MTGRGLIALLLVCSTGMARAQEFRNELTLQSDNDAYLFYGQDRYYTNGLFLTFRHAANQEKLRPKLEKRIYELTVGQQMYNPISGYRPDPASQDRPFAGYLFAEGRINWFYRNESVLRAGLAMGTIGPAALGREAQELLHRLVGFYEIAGWDYQIGNEAALNLSMSHLRLLHRANNGKSDFSLEANARLGNTFTGAGAGVLFRAGNLQPLFQSAATRSSVSNRSKTKPREQDELFFYARPQLDLVIYDATLQGGLFHKSSEVTFAPKRLVFAQQLGLMYSSRRFTLDYSLTFRSREVKSPALPHQFGSITLGYRFN